MDISWTPPKFANGVVRYYLIQYCLDDLFEQQPPGDLIDIVEEQKLITEQRNITVQDTKVISISYSYNLMSNTFSILHI